MSRNTPPTLPFYSCSGFESTVEKPSAGRCQPDELDCIHIQAAVSWKPGDAAPPEPPDRRLAAVTRNLKPGAGGDTTDATAEAAAPQKYDINQSMDQSRLKVVFKSSSAHLE